MQNFRCFCLVLHVSRKATVQTATNLPLGCIRLHPTASYLGGMQLKSQMTTLKIKALSLSYSPSDSPGLVAVPGQLDARVVNITPLHLHLVSRQTPDTDGGILEPSAQQRLSGRDARAAQPEEHGLKKTMSGQHSISC